MMKSKDLQPRLLYPAKLSFRMEGQIKCFPDKKKLKELPKCHYHQASIMRNVKEPKKIKHMNNKMIINTYLSTFDSKKQNKQ